MDPSPSACGWPDCQQPALPRPPTSPDKPGPCLLPPPPGRRQSGEGGILDVGTTADPLIILGDELREKDLNEDGESLIITRELGERGGLVKLLSRRETEGGAEGGGHP